MFNSERRQIEKQMRKENRLPPGQSVTLKFPVLHYGHIPEFEPERWTLRAFGLIKKERLWDWPAFQQLPTKTITVDIHCVTRWSKFDTVWEGVPFKTLVDLVEPTSEAKHIIVHCDGGYTTNLPLSVMSDDDVMLAYKYDGDYLTPDHGFPVRTLVPKRYFWKSAKWVRGIEFAAEDRPGFWEKAGYHNEGNPWKEERHAKFRSGSW